MVTEQTPKVGDVKSQSDGATSFYTARELKGLQPSTGNAIPLNAMAGDVPVPKVTQPQPGQTGPALETQMGAVGDEFTRNLETQRAQAQTNEQASFQSYLDSVLNAPTQAGAEAKAYEKGGVNVLQEQLNDQAGQLRSEQDFLRTRTEQVQKNMEGMNAQAIQDEVNRIRNESLSRQASISVNLLTAQSRFDSAKAVADRYVDSVMEQSERKSAALQTMYERNFNLFSKTEQREFETKQADRLQAQQAQRENLQRLQDTKLEALKMATLNNAPAEVRSLVASAQTPEEVYQYGGQWVGADLLDREAKRANIAQSYASAAASAASQRKSEAELKALSNTSTGAGNIAVQALDSFSGALQQNQREQFTRSVTNAVGRGNTEQVEIALKNAAQVAGGAALREEVIKRDQAINALRDVKSSLDAYNKAGGNTNLLTGGYEDLQQKLGQTSDPKLAAIETRIGLALNAYTNAVSGASFTPQESARYASLFPSTSNTNVLNTTKIDTLVDSFEANNQSFYGNFLGGYTPSQVAEQAVYEELVANATPEQLREAGITQ